MQHFFTKSTVEARIWCKKCGKETMWKIADGRPLHCEECQAAADFAWKQAQRPAPVKRMKPPPQLSLFDYTEDP